MVFPYLDPSGTRPTVLADRLGVSRQAVHQLIGPLRDQGLVELVADPQSGRSKLVCLTDRGRESVAVAERGLAALEDQLTTMLGSDEANALSRLLAAAFAPDSRD